MGNVYRGDPQFPEQTVDIDPQSFAQQRVQCRQRLVEQKDLGLHGNGPRQRHTLALAPGQLVDTAAPQLLDMHHLQHLVNAAVHLRRGHPADLQTVGDIPLDIHVGEQGVGLEHHADVTMLDGQIGDILIIEIDPSAGIGALKAGNDPQGGGLAAARWTEKHDGFSAGDIHGDRFQRPGAVGKGLGAGLESDRCTEMSFLVHAGCILTCRFPSAHLRLPDAAFSCPAVHKAEGQREGE